MSGEHHGRSWENAFLMEHHCGSPHTSHLNPQVTSLLWFHHVGKSEASLPVPQD